LHFIFKYFANIFLIDRNKKAPALERYRGKVTR
jgi:hypothetical protein